MGIPLSVFKDREVQNIKACITAGVFRTDSANKWTFDKINQIIDFWKGKPFDNVSGSYKFGSAILREIKDIIWYPDRKILVSISSSGEWKHLKTKEEIERFMKLCGFTSYEHFEKEHPLHFEKKVLFWNRKEVETIR